MFDLATIMQILWTSVATSSYYVLFALSFALALKVNKVFNFTQAAVMSVAFYTAYGCVQLLDWPAFIALPLALVAALVLSWFIEVFGFSILRERKVEMLFVFIFTFMVSQLTVYLISLAFGTWSHTIFQSMFWPVTLVGPIAISGWDIPALVVAFGSAAILFAFLRFSRWGQFMVAVSDNPDLAELYGIEKRKVYLLTILIAGALAAIGMFLYGMRAQVQPRTSLDLMLFATVATIIGGIGNLFGALIAAVGLAVIQNASILFISSEWQAFLVYAILFATIIFLPGGLRMPKFGTRFETKTREISLAEETPSAPPSTRAE